MSIHPAVVIAAVAVLSTAFGLLGTLLAVPARRDGWDIGQGAVVSVL